MKFRCVEVVVTQFFLLMAFPYKGVMLAYSRKVKETIVGIVRNHKKYVARALINNASHNLVRIYNFRLITAMLLRFYLTFISIRIILPE